MTTALTTVGAGIFLALGVVHAVFTLQSTPDGGPMMPTSPDVRSAMSMEGGLGLAPGIESNLYRAWIGFNLSHSVGVIVIAGLLMWQALDDLGAAANDARFLTLVFIVPPLYLAMAQRYWFDKPRNGIAVATVLLWAGTVLELV